MIDVNVGSALWLTQAVVPYRAGHLPKPDTAPLASIYDHALTVGFPRGFVVAAGIALLALLIGIGTSTPPAEESSCAPYLHHRLY